MAVTALNNIKNWFKTGLKPSQAQFWDTWDSFFHKSEKIPVASIEGIDDLLQSKVSSTHLNDTNAHADLFDTKLDKGDYTGDAQDLSNRIEAIKYPNALLSSVPPTKVGNQVTFPASMYIARINQIQVLNLEFSTTIAVAANNYHRTDLIELREDGTLNKKVGDESLTEAFKPSLSANAVEVTTIDVFGSVINDPSTPYDSSSLLPRGGYPGTAQDLKNDIDTKGSGGYKNVMHFGNSICKHPILAGIWWGAWGMAATVRENDYVHRFLTMLQTKYPSAASDALNIAPWETNYATFDKSTLDPYLIGKDLVVLRLGENVTYYADFQNQYKILVQYIQTHAPNARIILGGQFWANATKENAMINVALELGLPFVSLNHLDSATYKQTIGGIVQGDDGLPHTITDGGVANHPNDLGMLKIAEGLFSAVDFYKETDRTTPQKTIIGNITLDNSFNGCIVKIKANATITVPSTLKPYFNCVFDSWTGFTGTFVAGSGVTISSSGLKLLSEKMGTLYKDGSAPVYRLKGETSV